MAKELISKSNLTQILQGTKKYVDEKVSTVSESIEGISSSLGDYVLSEEYESKVGEIEESLGKKLENSDLSNLATKNEVTEAVGKVKDDIVGGATGAYDTLKEIEEYINTHGESAAALTAEIAKKADKTELANFLSKEEATSGYQPKGDYLTEDDLEGLASEQWVESKGYLVDSDITVLTTEEVNGILSSVFGVTVQ